MKLQNWDENFRNIPKDVIICSLHYIFSVLAVLAHVGLLSSKYHCVQWGLLTGKGAKGANFVAEFVRAGV